ncbi:MAG: ABC transporter ATP-binding protein [Nitrososphaerales archaeon]
MCAQAVIEFLNATKDYGSTKTIGPVTFSINPGEVMGFLGPNGSGKTTCIRMLLGLMRPTLGSVRIRGRDPSSEHAIALRRVGYSPELPNIQAFLTPRELLFLVAKELQLPAGQIKSQTVDVLELVGLSKYIDVKISKFSKGMVQRLSIAQGMIGDPDILVMDEPMIGLDPAGTAHFREVFQRFSDKGGTIFLSSHIMQEVESLCTSICMIHNGKILFKGTLSETIGKVLGSSFLIVEADPVDESLIKALSGIPGVLGVERKMQNGRALELKVQAGEEVRPQVAQIVVDSGAKLYSLDYSENLLERTYIQALMQGDAIS